MLFSLPVGTEMFHFPTFPPHTLYIQVRVTRHHSCWVSPFGHPRITARLTAPRGLSQPPTSFIGSWCQGIHRTLLKTYKTKMLASTVQFSNNTPTRNFHPHQPKTSKSPRGMTEIRADRIILPGKNVCSFRTQQCVDISTTTENRASAIHDRSCQRSTHEQPSENIRFRNGLCQEHTHLCEPSWRNAP